MSNQMVEEAIAQLDELRQDADASKRLKEKTESVISLLQKEADLSVDKALFELEGLNSSELGSYHRTKIWDIISLLESAKVQSK